MLRILLIDDDELEVEILRRNLIKFLNPADFTISYASKCSEAIEFLLVSQFHLILLDNMLNASISGEFSAPIIKQYSGVSPVIIISNNIEVDYLGSPQTLGVDDVVAKSELEAYFRTFLSAHPALQSDERKANAHVA